MSVEASSTSQPAPSKANQRLVECFERGSHLMTVEKNHDYAHAMFAECVAQEPANLTYVESLLQNLQLKFAGQKKKASLFGRSGSRELKKALAQNQWKALFRQGTEILKDHPWDVETLRVLAQACAVQHFNEVELAYLKQALEANPKDIETNKHCARSLARMGQFDQAIACWHRIETIRPGDKEAAKMIGELSEEKLIFANSRPVAIASQAVQATTSATTDEQATAASMEIRLSPRQELERAIVEDPYDVANYLELTDLLCDDEFFGEAEGLLNRGIATVGEHSALVDRLERVRVLRAEREIRDAEARRKAAERLQRKPVRIPWLELMLGIAAIFLLLQFFPALGSAIWRLIDVRNWSRLTWFMANIFVLIVLCAIRLGPELFRSNKKTQGLH